MRNHHGAKPPATHAGGTMSGRRPKYSLSTLGNPNFANATAPCGQPHATRTMSFRSGGKDTTREGSDDLQVPQDVLYHHALAHALISLFSPSPSPVHDCPLNSRTRTGTSQPSQWLLQSLPTTRLAISKLAILDFDTIEGGHANGRRHNYTSLAQTEHCESKYKGSNSG